KEVATGAGVPAPAHETLVSAGGPPLRVGKCRGQERVDRPALGGRGARGAAAEVHQAAPPTGPSAAAVALSLRRAVAWSVGGACGRCKVMKARPGRRLPSSRTQTSSEPRRDVTRTRSPSLR